MSYEDTLTRLAEGTARVVVQLWESVQHGLIPAADFPRLAADLIALANVRGAAVAQLAFRGYLEAAYELPTPVAVTVAADDTERLHKALRTILASNIDTVMQLTRLATNEPLNAAADAYHDEMDRSTAVSGWRRGLEGDACQLCRWWWRDGRVFRTEHRMPRHPGCSCHQIPVVNETTSNYQTERQARQAANTRRTA